MTSAAHKVMLLGEIGVGKSSIAQRLVFNRFESSYKPTIGVDVYRYEADFEDGGDGIPMIVWDSDGNLGNAIFRHVYLREASAAIIVADVTRADTVAALSQIASAFRARLPGRSVCFILNKVDLAPTPSVELPKELTDYPLVFQTSALTGENIKKAFSATAQAIVRRS